MKYKTIQVPVSPDNEIYESSCACGMISNLLARNVKSVPKCLNCNKPLSWYRTGKYNTTEIVPDDTPEQVGTGNPPGT